MKQVYSYQEIGTLIDKVRQVAFTRTLPAHITALQNSRECDEITVTIALIVGEYVIAELETTYPRIEALLDAFDIGDLEEIWEVLE
jgi:hypothetical protein